MYYVNYSLNGLAALRRARFARFASLQRPHSMHLLPFAITYHFEGRSLLCSYFVFSWCRASSYWAPKSAIGFASLGIPQNVRQPSPSLPISTTKYENDKNDFSFL